MSNDITESILYAKGYRINSKGEWYLPPKDSRLPPAPEREPDTSNEPMASSEGADDGAGFRVVRITSYRVRLIDERNLYDKYIVDALVRAKLIRDDSPKWCRVEVKQVQVARRSDERTEIEIDRA